MRGIRSIRQECSNSCHLTKIPMVFSRLNIAQIFVYLWNKKQKSIGLQCEKMYKRIFRTIYAVWLSQCLPITVERFPHTTSRIWSRWIFTYWPHWEAFCYMNMLCFATASQLYEVLYTLTIILKNLSPPAVPYSCFRTRQFY